MVPSGRARTWSTVSVQHAAMNCSQVQVSALNVARLAAAVVPQAVLQQEQNIARSK